VAIGPDAARSLGHVTPDWAWGEADGGSIRVAVVDSGIEENHPAVGRLAGAVAVVADPLSPGGARVTVGGSEDSLGHGTACAAVIRSLAPRAELYSVRVLDGKNTCSGIVLAAALRWAVDNGMNVVNLSVSARNHEHYALLHEVADLAYFRNVMVVCAINNNPVAPSYPSTFASVFSVAAHADQNPFVIRFWSRPPAEIGASGIGVEVVSRSGENVPTSGNSFAAAHVSGLMALILSKHPWLTPFQMKTVLHAVARDTATDTSSERSSR
jgi:subtilisin